MVNRRRGLAGGPSANGVLGLSTWLGKTYITLTAFPDKVELYSPALSRAITAVTPAVTIA